MESRRATPAYGAACLLRLSMLTTMLRRFWGKQRLCESETKELQFYSYTTAVVAHQSMKPKIRFLPARADVTCVNWRMNPACRSKRSGYLLARESSQTFEGQKGKSSSSSIS
eukprot:TRINITY_DN23274_c0_g1_i1.p2 TRINITY_DN23274_c0_g1~~TRINITY_DN23274_c0_g1_i1.p2  ORF type:complete len:112 (+),score=9.56 TRINITY_DN23274_c0_g1_i1:1202-1537(+)